ncbi:MAG TPA: hypothetical protein VIF32_08760 [Gemmatimonadaceae bacterium]|jgi:hypothetical protein
MRCTVSRRNAWAVALAGIICADCGSSTENKQPAIELSVTNSAATVAQGTSTTIPVVVARTNFTGTVAVTVEGAPDGVSAIVTPASVDNSVPSTVLQITASAAATPGLAALTVRGTGTGIAEKTVTVNLTVNVTGNFSLDVLSSSVTVAQGGGGVQTIFVPRSGGNGGNVSLAASGLPSGITTTFTPAPTTTSNATLTIAAASGTAPGTYPVTITGTSPGLSNQTTTFSIVVIAPPSTANVSIPFCSGDFPVWFAFQNEGFAWQQVTPTGTAFTFAATQKLAVAYTFQSGSAIQINIFNLTRAELSAKNERDCSGTKTLSGSASGLIAGQSARVVMGAASANASAIGGSTFTLTNVNARPLDLVATRGTVPSGDFLTPDRMIVRRSVNFASGATIPVLDFSAAESFAPAATNLTVTGLAQADVVELQNTFWSVTSTFGVAHAAQLTSGSTTLYSVPSGQQVAGDLHELFIDASQTTSSLVVGRSFVAYFSVPGDRTDAMGPSLNTPTILSVTSSPYSRLRGTLAAQAEYNTFVEFGYYQDLASAGSRYVITGVSAAYLGATPTSWDVLMPDFTGTTGFNSSWMLGPGRQTNYVAEAFSGRTDLLFGALPALGDVVRLAYRVAVTNTPLVQARAMRTQGRVQAATTRARLPLQYLRR